MKPPDFQFGILKYSWNMSRYRVPKLLINVREAIPGPFHAVWRGSGIVLPKLIHAHWKWTKQIPDYLVGACQLQRYVALRCP